MRDPLFKKLLAGLGTNWEVKRTCTKRHPARVTAHTPLHALEDLRKRRRFEGGDILEMVMAAATHATYR